MSTKVLQIQPLTSDPRYQAAGAKLDQLDAKERDLRAEFSQLQQLTSDKAKAERAAAMAAGEPVEEMTPTFARMAAIQFDLDAVAKAIIDTSKQLGANGSLTRMIATEVRHSVLPRHQDIARKVQAALEDLQSALLESAGLADELQAAGVEFEEPLRHVGSGWMGTFMTSPRDMTALQQWASEVAAYANSK